MYFWPNIKLTDYEKQFVDVYTQIDKDGRVVKPGVLRRCYTLTLANVEQRTKGIAAQSLVKQVQISRRARIFAITFSGNTDSFRLSVKNSNGTMYVNPTPRSQQFPIVTSLIAGSAYNSLATGGKVAPIGYNHAGAYTDGIGDNPNFSPQFMPGKQSFPWLIEPNWICQPNETLIFQATDASLTYGYNFDAQGPIDVVVLPKVLNITVFAWEFPGMKF